MNFVSTRGAAPAVPFAEAALSGLAPDGGLYVPERWPTFDPQAFDADRDFCDLAAEILRPFLAGDVLEPHLDAICRRAFDFPMPLVHLQRRTSLLELFCGPTAAFKDFGARFLADCFATLLSAGDDELTILVATSGDTGAAVASACHRKPGMRVAILFPKGGVSMRQRHQLTCWDGNVRSFEVRGRFDDCQRVVKQTFELADWPRNGRLSSANSINIGRLLPQAVFYSVATLRYMNERGNAPGFVVPSGNVGNSVGAFWSRRMGFPLRHVAMATNANHVVPDWFRTGNWEPHESISTLANAMDVGNPSNMERVFHLFPDRDSMLANASSLSVNDDTIRSVIAAGPDRWGRVFCPHTATAMHFREQLDGDDWIVVATAHPAKFESIVEPLIGCSVDVPPRLAELLERPTSVTEIDADIAQLTAALDQSSSLR